MTWFKKNPLKVALILLHALALCLLFPRGYETKGMDWSSLTIYIGPIMVGGSLALVGLAGFFSNRHWGNLLTFLAGLGVTLFFYHPSLQDLSQAVSNINSYLLAASPVPMTYFYPIMAAIFLLCLVMGTVGLVIYPFGLFLTDAFFVAFLWGVGRLKNPQEQLLLLGVLWVIHLVHHRLLQMPDRQGTTLVAKNYQPKLLAKALIPVLLLTLLLPVFPKHNKGKYYDQLWIKLNDFIMQDQFVNNALFVDAFNIGTTGYSDSTVTLGGDVTTSDEVAFKLSGDVPAYLRGNTRLEYTGNSWPRRNDIYTTANEVPEVVSKSYQGAKQRKVTLEPVGIRTSSIFTPSYPISVMFTEMDPDLRVYYSLPDNTFMIPKATDLSYEVTYAEEDTIRKNPPLPTNIYGKDPYLSLPENISQRVKNLAQKVVQKETDPLIIADKMTEFLRQRIQYSLTPGDLPEGEELTDYVLFQKNEGYCVYFATALTVMLRSVGVPARYVEGFRVSDEKDETGKTLIRNSDAHAWTEVLGPQGQWLIFDATGTPREMLGMGPEEEQETSPSTVPVTDPQEESDESGELTKATRPEGTTEPSGTSASPEVESPTQEAPLKIPDWLPWTLAFLSLPIAMYFLRKQRLAKLLNQKDPRPFLGYVLRLFQKAGHKIPQGYTVTEIAKELPTPALQEVFAAFAKDYNKERFGPKSSDSAWENRRVRYTLLEESFSYYEKEKGKVKGLFKRYFL